ncbi:4-(cytidine 5'-diphospho)-2-C-methyl-D-erythritol kinase [Tautonia marina]|uniref:4-(cytidine 5'-diphospho)-2-C-methyl-D-erythritol kinase n=1 Tax=Tautonia marina TaxID=2653855 RepID=UPI001260E715|nr:4-(cytidine 5'-diphospho)-2-C-methyl-D-erythritol kinase [Tautonia marina]
MVIRPLAEGVEVLAPAKLNLFLEVLGKRPDGFHELETLMVAIDLHDRLTLAADDSGQIVLTCDDPSLPTGAENLVVKAAETLRAEAGPDASKTLGARISLEKAIPAQAGLGGGSSDAAATLVALDRLWNLHTPAGRLRELAGQIGSDVPFFLDAPVAVCRGRGERVEPLNLNPDTIAGFHAILVCPPVGVRTADAFAGLTPPDRPEPIEPVIDALRSSDSERLGRRLFNRLQPVAERIQPALGRVRAALNDLGSSVLDGHLMSGSGSAYFGLARNREAAELAASRLGDLGIGMVRVVRCGP